VTPAPKVVKNEKPPQEKKIEPNIKKETKGVKFMENTDNGSPIKFGC
jgi:hypothetical protein